MAAKESSISDIKKEELEDITTCCICTEVFTDPKALPCIHTFCMKCLRETGLKTDKGPGDEMPCPICRRLFTIPTEGFHGLPTNFFIERLIQMANATVQSASSRALCSVCLEEGKGEAGTEIPTAANYCVDCKRKLCEDCCSEHRHFKLTKSHKLIPITEQDVDQKLMTEPANKVCEVHEQKVLDVYCADCNTNVCAICFTENHSNHKGSKVDKYLNDFRRQIQSNIEAINECICQVQMGKAKLLKMKGEMHQRVEGIECDVEKRKVEIKELADKHANYLLRDLCSKRQCRLKEIQMTADDINVCLSNLVTFNSYCQKIMDEESASDICGTVSDLSVRKFELQQKCKPIIERGIQDFKFCFRPSELEECIEEDCGKLIGEIEEEVDFNPKKRSRLKQSQFAEQSNEIDRLRKINETERSEKERFRLANEQLRIKVSKQDVLRDDLMKEISDYKAHVDKLKQELDSHVIAYNALDATNEELKKKLNAEIMAKANKHLEEVDVYKATVKTLESNAETLRTELETSKAENRERIWFLEQKLEQQKTRFQENEHLIKQSQEQHRFRGQPGKRSDPVFVKTIATKAAKEKKKDISGLAILDRELFVVSQLSSEVEVYDSIKLNFSRRWHLKELIDSKDIGSCNKNKRLYILDYKGRDQMKEVLMVDLYGKLIKNWSIGHDYGWNLSVTDESNVLLAVYDKNKLNEYSPDGLLIREINLSSDRSIHHPLHAIKLNNGSFVVSHGDELHRVCIVDASGKLRKSFGGKPGSTIGQMNLPFHLSVDRDGFVMVCDQLNGRVLLLDSDVQYKREILSKKDGNQRLHYPEKILQDEPNGRLFVADNDSNNQRILVFNFE